MTPNSMLWWVLGFTLVAGFIIEHFKERRAKKKNCDLEKMLDRSLKQFDDLYAIHESNVKIRDAATAQLKTLTILTEKLLADKESARVKSA